MSYFRRNTVVILVVKGHFILLIIRVESHDAISDRTAKNWYKKFKEGHTNLQEKPSHGKPSVVDHEVLCQRFEAYSATSTRQLSQELGPSRWIIERYLHHLGKTKNDADKCLRFDSKTNRRTFLPTNRNMWRKMDLSVWSKQIKSVVKSRATCTTGGKAQKVRDMGDSLRLMELRGCSPLRAFT